MTGPTPTPTPAHSHHWPEPFQYTPAMLDLEDRLIEAYAARFGVAAANRAFSPKVVTI